MAKIGIQISSVKPLLTTPEQVMDSFAKARRIGYQAMQVQWVSPEVPDEAVARALRENDLDCISTQDYYQVYVPDIDHIIRQNLLWGSRDICISGIPADRRSVAGIESMIQEIRSILPKVTEAGLTLSYHPRSQEYDLFEGISGMERIVDAIPELRICLDLYHTEKAGLDTVGMLHKYDGRIDIVHFKDDIAVEEPTSAAGDTGTNGLGPKVKRALMPIGQGHINWKPIIQAVNETAVKYALAEQESWSKDPFECLQESYDFMVSNGISKD